jgi:Flp pilus assembly protein CpaB
MRASTLLGLALAMGVGLVGVAGIRYSGIFSRTPPPTPEKKEPILVLMAAKNLYEGSAATSLDVATRPASEEEIKLLRSNPEKVMPPFTEAAHLRILKRNVPVGEMLLREYFEDISIPAGVGMRLAPGMRAVDVELPKERADAGLLRLGERVDVYLTSKVCTDAAGSNPRTATAAIAKDLKVIVKRDILYTLMIPVPEDKPVSFILEANPYRAALVEFAKTRGLLTLVASSMKAKEADSSESEKILVEQFVQGKASVSERDLEAIFQLPDLPAVAQPLRVETYEAGKLSNVTIVPTPVPGRYERIEGGYHFLMPSEGLQVQARHDGKKDAGPSHIGVKPTPPKKK